MFLIGQNVFYLSNFAGLAYLDHCSTGMAKAIEHSYAYPKTPRERHEPSSVSDLKYGREVSMDRFNNKREN